MRDALVVALVRHKPRLDPSITWDGTWTRGEVATGPHTRVSPRAPGTPSCPWELITRAKVNNQICNS